jgi:hypothetical protein
MTNAERLANDLRSRCDSLRSAENCGIIVRDVGFRARHIAPEWCRLRPAEKAMRDQPSRLWSDAVECQFGLLRNDGKDG